MLRALTVVAFKLGTVWPVLDAVAVLLIVEPFAFVAGSVKVRIDPKPTRLIINPLPIIYVTFSMYEPPLPIGHAIFPEPIVSRPIRPYLNTSAVFSTVLNQPLPLIDSSSLHLSDGPDFAGFFVIGVALSPVEWPQTLNDILNISV